MRKPVVLALLVVLLTMPLAARRSQRAAANPTTADLVELDVLALDKDGAPVTDLRLEDFEVKDDGHVVEIKTFAAPTPPNDPSRPGRQVVLLLDDSSVPMSGTAVVQAMAQVILSRQQRGDEVTVVRLNNDRDEAFGDLETAWTRILQYHAGAVPFQGLGTAERALKVVAAISRQLEPVDHRRKVIACVGGPRVCNVLEPQPRGYSNLWPAWVQAVTSAGRANAAVYAVMPLPAGSPLLLAGGLVQATGGDGFANAMKFDRFVDNLWREATDYYLLGYWPSTTKRDLHSIDIKVSRKGVHARARRAHG
jgi:VWFA-related protein